MNSYPAGIARIWVEDRYAIAVTLALILIQLAVFFHVWTRTWTPLRRERRGIRDFAKKLTGGRIPSSTEIGEAGKKVERAWQLAFGDGPGEPMEVDSAFEPARLLPGDFNPRLDAAAPGLFTALGIVGTFVGLILGFLRVDPGNATVSMGPLIGGMVVAFFNSLVGVFLSILWSYTSRHLRHSFDCACDELLAKVERRERPRDLTVRLLEQTDRLVGATLSLHVRMDAGMSDIREGLGSLSTSTTASSRELLENLSPRIQDSFRNLVNLPFDRLDASVGRFDQIVRNAAAVQAQAASHLSGAATVLGDAERELAAVLGAASEATGGFRNAAATLQLHTESSERLLRETRGAAEGLGTAAAEVRRAASQYEETAAALAGTTAGLGSASRALQAQTSEFHAAGTSLRDTVRSIGEISRAGAEEGAAAVRGELRVAVDAMAAGLREVGETTVTAYEQSSHRIMSTVNARVTDLTDRLSEELATLSARLPAEVEALNGAMSQIRASIEEATRGMDQAANDLARETPERLRAYLRQLDEELARAVDRFSGTLAQWDERVGEVGELTGELRRLTAAVEKRRAIRIPLAGTSAT